MSISRTDYTVPIISGTQIFTEDFYHGKREKHGKNARFGRQTNENCPIRFWQVGQFSKKIKRITVLCILKFYHFSTLF